MCFGGGGTTVVDNSGKYARQEAEKREARIREGQGNIDTAFNVFDPSYFDTYKQNYLNVYNPQVDQQYGDASQQLRYGVERQGLTNSTPGIKRNERLNEAYADRRRELGSNALTATNQLRGQVENNKSELYQLNSASADPSLALLSAVGRAGALQTVPTYSPLGDLFGGLINAGAQYYNGYQNRLPAEYRPYFTASGSGSGRVVR